MLRINQNLQTCDKDILEIEVEKSHGIRRFHGFSMVLCLAIENNKIINICGKDFA